MRKLSASFRIRLFEYDSFLDKAVNQIYAGLES